MNENRNRSGRILLTSCVLTLLFFPLGYFLLNQQADWPEVKTPVMAKGEVTNELTLHHEPPPIDLSLMGKPDLSEAEIAKINRSGTSKTAMLVSVPRLDEESIVIQYPPDGILCGGEFYLNKTDTSGSYNSWALDETADIPNLSDIKACIQYPDSLKRLGIEGEVLLRVKIGKAGEIEVMEVHRCTHPLFSEPVLKCMKNAKGKAGTINGEPVKSWVVVPFKFRMNQ